MTFQTLAVRSNGNLVGASANMIYEVEPKSGEVVLETNLEHQHKGEEGHLRHILCITVEGKEYLITCTDDKWLLVFLYDDGRWKLQSRRVLIKRANCLAFSETQKEIVVGDKFGDVYLFPLQSEDLLDEKQAINSYKPILGHVSLLLSMVLYKTQIFTSDRDEHIRVSEFPKGYIIDAFLLGSKYFVSAMCILNDDICISGGGDPTLQVFSISEAKLLSRISLNVLEPYASATIPEESHAPPFAIKDIIIVGDYLVAFSLKATSAFAIPLANIPKGKDEQPATGSFIVNLGGMFVDAIKSPKENAIYISLDKQGCAKLYPNESGTLEVNHFLKTNLGSEPPENLLYPLNEVVKSYDSMINEFLKDNPTEAMKRREKAVNASRTGKRAAGRAQIEENFQKAKKKALEKSPNPSTPSDAN